MKCVTDIGKHNFNVGSISDLSSLGTKIDSSSNPSLPSTATNLQANFSSMSDMDALTKYKNSDSNNVFTSLVGGHKETFSGDTTTQSNNENFSLLD